MSQLDMQSADTSPPDRKRARRSPAEIPKGATPMPYPPTPQMGTGPLQGPSGPLPQPPPSAGMQSHMMRTNIGPPGGPGHQQMAMNGIIPPSMPGQPGPPQAMGGMHSPMGPPMGMNNMVRRYCTCKAFPLTDCVSLFHLRMSLSIASPCFVIHCRPR